MTAPGEARRHDLPPIQVQDRYSVDLRLLVPGARVHAINLESGACVLLAVGRRRLPAGTPGVLAHRGLPVAVEEASLAVEEASLAVAEAAYAVAESSVSVARRGERCPAGAARMRLRAAAAAVLVLPFAAIAGGSLQGGDGQAARASATLTPVTLLPASLPAAAFSARDPKARPIHVPRPRRRPPRHHEPPPRRWPRPAVTPDPTEPRPAL